MNDTVKIKIVINKSDGSLRCQDVSLRNRGYLRPRQRDADWRKLHFHIRKALHRWTLHILGSWTQFVSKSISNLLSSFSTFVLSVDIFKLARPPSNTTLHADISWLSSSSTSNAKPNAAPSSPPLPQASLAGLLTARKTYLYFTNVSFKK